LCRMRKFAHGANNVSWAVMANQRAAGDPDARPGLRERKKQATRRALGVAALRLAVERGLDNVLVEDIAAAADVSPRTFNNYFASKHEAICTLGVDRARRIGDALRGRPAAEPLWDAVTEAVLQHYDGADGVPDRAWIAGLRLVMGAPELQGEYLKVDAEMQRILAEAIAERVGDDSEGDMLPQVLAGAVTAASQVAVRRWLRTDPPTPLRPLIRRALQQLAAACAGSPEPGRSDAGPAGGWAYREPTGRWGLGCDGPPARGARDPQGVRFREMAGANAFPQAATSAAQMIPSAVPTRPTGRLPCPGIAPASILATR